MNVPGWEASLLCLQSFEFKLSISAEVIGLIAQGWMKEVLYCLTSIIALLNVLSASFSVPFVVFKLFSLTDMPERMISLFISFLTVWHIILHLDVAENEQYLTSTFKLFLYCKLCFSLEKKLKRIKEGNMLICSIWIVYIFYSSRPLFRWWIDFFTTKRRAYLFIYYI